MKFIPLLLLVIMEVTFICGCASKIEIQAQIIEDITAQKAFELMQESKSNSDFIIVDVRTPAEFNEGHIENAVNIDFNSGSFESEIGKFSRDKKYLIHCRSGVRSRDALAVMVKLDFKEVHHLYEGIIGWNKEGYPTIK